MCFCFEWMKTATDAEHKCACAGKQIWLQSKTEKKGKKKRLRWSIPLLMITWSHTYRTKHLKRWIMGPSPPLQQNHSLHLPLDVWLPLILSITPSPPPHHSFFMFVCVSNRERHTITWLLSLMVWSEAHSSHRLRACATVNSVIGAPRGMSAHQGQTPKKHLPLWPLTVRCTKTVKCTVRKPTIRKPSLLNVWENPVNSYENDNNKKLYLCIYTFTQRQRNKEEEIVLIIVSKTSIKINYIL